MLSFGPVRSCLCFFILLSYGQLPLAQSTTSSNDSPANSTDSTAPPTAQLAKPPQTTVPVEEGTTVAGAPSGTTAAEEQQQKAPKVARQSPPPPSIPSPDAAPFAPLKPESKDEMFARIDSDTDGAIDLQDYMNRDRYYVESVRTEFNDIDTNRDGKVTKAEFDSFVHRLDEQRRAAMLNASNFTLQKNDANKDGELSVDELSNYINGTLQRSVAQLPEVFRQFDKDGNRQLNLDEFHELDFNFPWERFPPSNEPMNAPNRQVFFNANGPVPPPFVNDQQAAVMPPVLPPDGGQMQAPNGAYGSAAIGHPPMPLPQPVRFYRWAA